MKNKMTSLLLFLKDDLNRLKDRYFIIGAGGLILQGVEIGDTSDIDILVSDRDAETLRIFWKPYLENNPTTKEGDLFKSDFSRYKFEPMDIEVMGELLINVNGSFEKFEIKDFNTLELGEGFFINVPTLEDFKRILLLFGREKDLKRLKILENQY